MKSPVNFSKHALRATRLRRRFAIALVLMSVVPLLYVGYLFNQYILVSPAEGMWIFAAVCFLVLMVACGALLVRGVFVSIAQIVEGAKAAAEGKVQPSGIQVEDGAEVGELAASINAIVERIRRDTNDLQSSQQELVVTKAKLLESYAKLEEAIDKLKKVDQMKSDFVANVAHELIHPLATIRGSLDIVLANLAQEDPQKKEILEISRRNMARLIRLVTDILDIARIESGKTHLRVETIDVDDMLREILVPLEKLFRDKGIGFRKNVAVTVPTFEADRDRIIQAVSNLLTNAAKYTPAHGQVALDVANNDGQIRFAISDNGPGISTEDQAKLFDKFSRVNKEKQEGTGLGLCITKDIVELHHGRIWVESTKGKGSTFAFMVPMRADVQVQGGDS